MTAIEVDVIRRLVDATASGEVEWRTVEHYWHEVVWSDSLFVLTERIGGAVQESKATAPWLYSTLLVYPSEMQGHVGWTDRDAATAECLVPWRPAAHADPIWRQPLGDDQLAVLRLTAVVR